MIIYSPSAHAFFRKTADLGQSPASADSSSDELQKIAAASLGTRAGRLLSRFNPWAANRNVSRRVRAIAGSTGKALPAQRTAGEAVDAARRARIERVGRAAPASAPAPTAGTPFPRMAAAPTGQSRLSTGIAQDRADTARRTAASAAKAERIAAAEREVAYRGTALGKADASVNRTFGIDPRGGVEQFQNGWYGGLSPAQKQNLILGTAAATAATVPVAATAGLAGAAGLAGMGAGYAVGS